MRRSSSIQTSADMQTWQTVTPAIVQQMGVDAATSDPIMKYEVDVTGMSQAFIRLQVSTSDSNSGLPGPAAQ